MAGDDRVPAPGGEGTPRQEAAAGPKAERPHDAGRPSGPDSAGIVASLRAAAGRLVRTPQRFLHPLRRRRARRALERAPAPRRVLFVCHGNICRSPYAEAALRRRVGGRVEVASAGFVGPGRPPPEEAVRVASERGLELAGHRSRLVTRDAVEGADLVVVMEPRQARALRRRAGAEGPLTLGDLDPGPVDRRAIRDPIFQPEDVFRRVYGRIDRCLEELVGAAGLLATAGGSEAAGGGREGVGAGKVPASRPAASESEG